MVRRFAAVTAAVLVLAACGDDDEAERPDASAHPELTAEEILDRIPDEVRTVRAVVAQESSGIGDEVDESRSEIIVVGEDVHLASEDGEFLLYHGKAYERDEPSDPWEPVTEEFVQAFEGLGEAARGAGRDLATEPDGDFVFERLGDELSDDQHQLRLRMSIDVPTSEDFQELFDEGFGQFSGAELPEELIPDRAQIQFDFWIDAESFLLIRQRQESTSYRNEEILVQSIEDWSYSDFNEPLELPGPLPD